MPFRQNLFPTPLVIDEVANSAALNAELEGLILERMAADSGLVSSNLGGWHSRRDLLEWGGAAARAVADHALALADANTSTVRGAALGWRVSAWANVSARSAVNVPHVHGASYWSAVYYIRVGEGEGGRLCLHDPRLPALQMHDPLLRFTDAGPEAVSRIRPKAGQIVLFPAWLMHSVEPWQGEGQRISMAMNLTSSARSKA